MINLFKTELQKVQKQINSLPSEDRGKLSDGYHTFEELYDHRCLLYIAMCRSMYESVLAIFPETRKENLTTVWRSKKHSNGTSMEGWFIMGMGVKYGQQITYHLPEKYWELTNFADTLPQAHPWDGHTSQDVLNRLMKIICQ